MLPGVVTVADGAGVGATTTGLGDAGAGGGAVLTEQAPRAASAVPARINFTVFGIQSSSKTSPFRATVRHKAARCYVLLP